MKQCTPFLLTFFAIVFNGNVYSRSNTTSVNGTKPNNGSFSSAKNK